MTYSNRLKIDGNYVDALPGLGAIGPIDGIFAPSTRRGDDDIIPGRDGALGASLPRDRYLISVLVTITGTSVANLNANVKTAVSRMCGGADGLVTLTRELDNGSGVDTYTANGRYVDGPWTYFGVDRSLAAQVDLQWYNLSGAWWDGSAWVTP